MTDDQVPAVDETPAASEQYVIRSATVEDAIGIAEAHVASWQTAYRGLLPQALLDGLSVERRTTQWQEDRFEQATLWVLEGIARSRPSTSDRAGGPTAPSSATPSVTQTSSRSATAGR